MTALRITALKGRQPKITSCKGNAFKRIICIIMIKILFPRGLFVSLHQKLASRVLKCTPTGLVCIVVGSGGKMMRVRMYNPLKINDYGNQED